MPIRYSKNYLCPSAWVSQVATRPVAFFCSLWSGCAGWTRNHAEVCESKFRSHYTCTLMRFVTCQPNFPAISHTRLPVLWRVSFHESSTLIWGLEIGVLGKAGTELIFLNLGFMLELLKGSPSGTWLNSSGVWSEHHRLSYTSSRWLHCAAKVECQSLHLKTHPPTSDWLTCEQGTKALWRQDSLFNKYIMKTGFPMARE